MRKILRQYGLVILLALVSMPSWAQPAAPRVEWQHDGVQVTRFEIVIDALSPVNVGMPTPTGTTYQAPLPALAAGQHTLVVRACNAAGCTGSVPIIVVRLATQVP